MLVVLLGGARSGKSRLAVDLAVESGAPVTFLATAEALDDEMASRIAAHRTERPQGWSVVEEPLALGREIAAAPSGHTLVLDCLSLWVANALEADALPDAIAADALEAAQAAASRPSLTVVVSNEVGMGVVPATPLGRSYRDVLGTVNRVFADASDEAALVVAGRRLDLHPQGPRV